MVALVVVVQHVLPDTILRLLLKGSLVSVSSAILMGMVILVFSIASLVSVL